MIKNLLLNTVIHRQNHWTNRWGFPHNST